MPDYGEGERSGDRDATPTAEGRSSTRASSRDDRSRAADRRSSTDVIAHRGFAGVAPENTVAAASAAAESADVIEIDVVPTGDDEVVVFHDRRLGERECSDRGLTDAEGVVWETDADTVTSARVLGTEETVPLLREVLHAVPSDVGVNVELKNPGAVGLAFATALPEGELAVQLDVWRPFVEDVLAILDDYDNEVLVSSFYEAALASTRELSNYPVAPLLWDSVEDGLDIARRYGAEAIHPAYTTIQGTPFYDCDAESDEEEPVDLLATAHEEGRDVNVFTVMTWYQAEQLAAAGVDGLIAEYPGLLGFGEREL